MELTECMDLYVVWEEDKIIGVFNSWERAEDVRESAKRQRVMEGDTDCRVFVSHRVLNEIRG
jgi:hypothetical protein